MSWVIVVDVVGFAIRENDVHGNLKLSIVHGPVHVPRNLAGRKVNDPVVTGEVLLDLRQQCLASLGGVVVKRVKDEVRDLGVVSAGARGNCQRAGQDCGDE